MWRKPDVKPSSPAPAVPAPVSTKPQEAFPAPPPAASSAPAFSAPAVQSASAASTSAMSRVGSGLKIRGEFSGSSDLYIDGDAQGKIHLAEACVTVGPHGHVQADIQAREIIVEGTVQGNLKASEKVRLGATSRVQGMILAPRIGIDDGAQFRGKVEVTSAGASNVSRVPEPATDAEALRPVSAHVESE